MRSWARARLTPIIALLGVAAAHAETGHSDSLQADYQSLLEWMFSSAPSALPSDGVAWKLDTAAWELDQGQVWYQRPTSGGRITGLVFQGSGRFHMSVPDPVELRQLRRFAADAELETLDEEFDALVVRVVQVIEELPGDTGLRVLCLLEQILERQATPAVGHWPCCPGTIREKSHVILE